MVRYLVDTDILIDFSRLLEPVRSRIREMVVAKDELGVCAVQLAEFYAGERRGKRPQFDAFLAGIPCWEITPEAAMRAGEYRYDMARRGRAIDTPDALNAAVAWSKQAVILTRNVKDYPMPDVRILVP